MSDLLRRQLRGRGRLSILEVGCSTGSNLGMLGEFGEVSAMEMHDPAVQICRRRHPDIPITKGAIPDYLDQSFDVICLFDVLEHIEDDREALVWIDQHLNSGGLLALTVPAFPFLWSRHDDLAHHFRRYRRGGLTRLLGEKFDLVFCSYFNFHLFPAIALVRLFQRAKLLPQGETEKAIGGTGLANGLLAAIFSAERFWLRFVNLPFGVSLVALAGKRG